MITRIWIISILASVALICRGDAISAESLYRRWSGLASDSLMTIGRGYDERNRPDSALVCYSIVADRYSGVSMRSDNDKRLYSRALNNLAYIYSVYYFDYSKSLSLLQKSADISRSIGYEDNLAYTYLNIGGIYLECNLLYGSNLFIDQIWSNLEKSLVLAIKTEKWDAALGSIINICQTTLTSPAPDRFRKTLDIIRAGNIPHDTYLYSFAMCYVSGVGHVLAKDYDSAVADFRRMAETIQPGDMQGPLLEVMAISSLGDAYAMQGDWTSAISVCRKVVDKARAADVRPEMAIAYRNLSRYYDMAGDAVSAKSSLFDYYNLKDSLLTAAELTQLGSMPLVGELDRINAFVLEEERRRRKIIAVTLASVACLVALAAYVLLLLRSNRRLKSYARQIYLKNVELMESRVRDRRIDPQESEQSENNVDKEEQKRRYSGNMLSDEMANEILESINRVLESSEAVYDSGFSLQQLAELTGYGYKHVSQVINDRLEKNFNVLLAETRIREACRRMMDIDNYGHFTIEHVGNSVGFKSRSNFSVTFKSVIGISPSEFQRNARADHQRQQANPALMG